MTKKWAVRLGMLAACACPYVFLGMYGDAALGSVAGYLPMLVWMGVECRTAARTGNISVLLGGNLLSFLSSLGFVLLFQTERWGWYFKPFTALGFLKTVSIAVLLAEGLLVCLFRAGKKCDTNHEEESL